MKIFISHSSKDVDAYEHLFKILNEMGHKVLNSVDINIGEIWIDKLKKTLHETDVLIPLITENFINSSWAQAELSSVLFGDKEIGILPIVIGNVFVPGYINHIQYFKVDTLQDITLESLNRIGFFKKHNKNIIISTENFKEESSNITTKNMSLLKNALKDNRLTLVCGAGISITSHIPSWNELLVDILNDVLNKKESSIKISAKELISIMPQSNLILGKYLKLLLQDDFEKMVQKYLYKYYNHSKDSDFNYAASSKIMKAIVDLARPKRTGQRLESIITFNFDELIEQALSSNGIEYCSIWHEGQIHGSEELPIYHVHGFLPNKTELESPNLVFSEEAYHSQFIDPYSWANLTQLNTYASNICLFIGLSLSDPNLRRLLDISYQRNKKRKHYIIMKKTNESSVSEIATMLFEQDAASLGLNVIWCSNYSEIPGLLKSIIK